MTFTIKGSLGTTIDEEVTLEITNMLGQTIYSSKFTAQDGIINEPVQLGSDIANGMYILNIHSVNGNSIFRFVVDK